jgi:hypothetical protein
MIRAENIIWPGLRGRQWFESDFPRGGIVGFAHLDRVASSAEELPPDQRRWFFGPYGFLLSRIQPIKLIPCAGRLGFFPIDPDIELAVRRVIGQQL